MGETIRNGLDALRARVGASRPVYAHIGVTFRCALKCGMCVVWKQADPSAELTPVEMERLAVNLRRGGVRFAAFGGGEPFRREDLPGLVAAVAGAGISVRVLTNGVGVSAAAFDSAVRAGMRDMSISFDSLDAGVMRRIHGGVDIMEKVKETIRLTGAALPGGSVPVINVCVSRLNIKKLPELARFAGENGFLASFIPVAVSPSEEESDGFAAADRDFIIPPGLHGAVREVYEKLADMKKKGGPVINSTRFLRHSAEYLTKGSSPWECDAGRLYVSVSPSGGVSICHRFDPFARFDDEDLPGRLRSIGGEPETVRRRTACPGCMRPCWAEVTHAVRHFPSGVEAFRTAGRARRIRDARKPGAAGNLRGLAKLGDGRGLRDAGKPEGGAESR